jgi:hypothetical protein
VEPAAGDAVDPHHAEVFTFGFAALSARSRGMNSPNSPVSTVSRVEDTPRRVELGSESIIPGRPAGLCPRYYAHPWVKNFMPISEIPPSCSLPKRPSSRGADGVCPLRMTTVSP